MNAITRRQWLNQVALGGGSLIASSTLGIGRAFAASRDFDVVVYGGTPSGIMAAVAAEREGKRTALVLGASPLGGMMTNGLGQTDVGNFSVVGGLAYNFFLKMGQYYGTTITVKFEPHAALAVFNEIVAESHIHVFRSALVEQVGVAKSGPKIDAIRLEDGTVILGKIFIDASYEGDLMAWSGASYHVGREARGHFKERLGGYEAMSFDIHSESPYTTNHKLLPGVAANPHETKGQADAKIQAYTFRLCLTDRPDNRIEFPKPPGYNPDDYELVLRGLSTGTRFHPGGALPNGKYDLNGGGGAINTDFIGASWAYPTASYADRLKIWNDHYDYQAGLLYFVGNDPRVSASLREDVRRYGLAADEFKDSRHWPRQLYIREARRLYGTYVMHESDVKTDLTKRDPIGMGSYSIDCHPVQIFANDQGRVEIEGTTSDVAKSVRDTQPYQIPYRALLPHATQVSNLLVSVCVSSSHVAFASLRLEPQYMIMGEAAGVAAAAALNGGVSIHKLNVDDLAATLQSYGAVLSLG